MTQRLARVAEVVRVLELDDFSLDTDNRGVQVINDRFVDAVRSDAAAVDLPCDDWTSFAYDVGVLLGEVAISRFPSLEWRLFTWGRSNVAYLQPVLMGFGGVGSSRNNRDLLRMTRAYMTRTWGTVGDRERLGSVSVRGVEVDVEPVVARLMQQPIDRNAFANWLEGVAREV